MMKTLNSRERAMLSFWRSGSTLAEIGIEYGLSRERVRQILKKCGAKRDNGGVYVRAKSRQLRDAERIEKEREKKKNSISHYFGCPHKEVLFITKGLHPWNPQSKRSRAFIQQKRSAGYRGIPWDLTFPQWWKIWKDSGYWMVRGRGANNYCMSRKGDCGGYSLGNVKICKNRENISESFDYNSGQSRYMLGLESAPTKDLRAFHLKMGGLKRKEIAQILGVNYNTAGQMICFGRKKFINAPRKGGRG